MLSNIPEELELTHEERAKLPPRAQKYISALENELQECKHALSSQEDELRRKRYSHWNRSRY